MRVKFGILTIALASMSLLVMACSGGTPTPAPTPVPISEALVTAKGEIVPDQYAQIAFDTGGTVKQINVQEGAQVKAGDTLAQLDTTDLELSVKNAQDALDVAQATLAQTKTPATPEEIAAAQASYDSAVAALTKVKAGPSQADLAAAQSAYNSALTAYNQAKNGPTGADLQILQSQLAKAKAALDQAQAAYDRAGGASNPYIALTPQALQLQQATQDYQIALANYNKAVSPDASTLAQAQANLAQAQATLQNLKDQPKAEDIAQAQSQVDSAKAQLDLKKQGARPEDVAVAEKHVQQAQTGLQQAQAQLAKATLKSPMNGTVTTISIREGEIVQPGAPVLTIADLTNLQVQTTDLDEYGAAKVQVGQQANITVNALNDQVLHGKVSKVADQSVLLASGDVSYPVTLILDQQDTALRWGMTVKVEFQQ